MYHTLNTIERHHRYAEKREWGDMLKCTDDWHLAHKFSSNQFMSTMERHSLKHSLMYFTFRHLLIHLLCHNYS